MRFVEKGVLNLTMLQDVLHKPDLYIKSTHRFWDDEYVSSQMLRYHLDPQVEAASRKHADIRTEADFIIDQTGMAEGYQVLDLGCGPGLYVREFARTGASITGLDLSASSIRYAQEHTGKQYNNTCFQEGNYLTGTLPDRQDVITLIYLDFCALSHSDQKTLLGKIHRALAPDGYFIFDVMTEHTHTDVGERITVCEQGLWSPRPYMEIYQAFVYSHPRAEGFQYTIIGEEGDMRVIRVFHRLFARQELDDLLHESGFRVCSRYRNLSGDLWETKSDTMALFCQKT